jgi:glycogen operon protein
MGVPMIGMGDEVRRTQRGNNNPFCQDNEISWFDWSLTDRYAEIRRFVRGLIDVRLALDMTRVMHGLPLTEFLRRSLVEFHGVRLHQPDWSENSHTLAVTVRSVIGTRMVHLILNSYEHPLDFELPAVASPTLPWRRVADTSIPPTTSPVSTAHHRSAAPPTGPTPTRWFCCAPTSTTPPTPARPGPLSAPAEDHVSPRRRRSALPSGQAERRAGPSRPP